MSTPYAWTRQRLARADRRWQRTPIRTRLTAATAATVTMVLIAVVVVGYVLVRHELLSNVDTQLRTQASHAQISFSEQDGQASASLAPSVGQNTGTLQLMNSAGQRQTTSSYTLPVTTRDKRIAADGGTWLRTESVDGVPLRVLTVQKGDGLALQVAYSLSTLRSELDKLLLAFGVLILLGLGMVSIGTYGAVRRTMRPVASLTEAAEQIAVTRDLTTRIEAYGDDELGRLAATFNTMIEALDRSLGQQRQLILDSSHELRTPLASLKTNVEVLHDIDRLSLDQRRALLDDIVTQLDELTGLVADVVELARGEVPDAAMQDVAYDDLVVHAVGRSRRHWPQVVFMLDAAEHVRVRGVPARLDRAVNNLLDNAGKFSPAGAVVDVTLTDDGQLTVADRGPGVPEESLSQVFERFYRADEARALPGSGLGLAIVKQVVDGHGGTVTLTNRPDGGAVVTMTLPVLPREDPMPMDRVETPQTVAG
jgi:two-component system, OmpR family, sensor histidine kinase MprB